VNTFQAQLEKAVLPPEYSYILEKPSPAGRFIKKTFEIYCKILFTLYCPLTVKGRENIPSASFIFCSNHNSHMDSGILMVASGLSFKNFAMMAAKDYFFDNERRKYFLNLLMNLIPVDRNANRHSMIEYIKACREFLRNGRRNLIIYPEGTRSLTGKIQPFKKGPAMIASELNLPIVPAFISGTHKAWPKGKVFMKPVPVKISIGKPVYPEEFNSENNKSNLSGFSVYRKITDEIEKRINQLMRDEIEKQS
jgi:1-acyl-sn-glycerol-3-phosphate acyltransferase/long-chain acyl-CoA synthetase